MILVLPWPVSTNKTWRRSGTRIHVSAKTATFRTAVKSIVVAKKAPIPITGELEVIFTLYPPDRRQRDEDNFAGKSLFDALTKAGVWNDDSQIRRKVVEWGEVTKGGAVMVEIVERPDLASSVPAKASQSKNQPKGRKKPLNAGEAK